ncbi:pyrroloquinoline quinone biosynthesis protein PqqE [Notoacmeibacter sp. MSK16QG-6]|uniref:pyrroloquinoline quinone biosynthesis protein PqqE n=1 Tax=Notoacmeibacter sp. MSK16QG-6 TaxID=2957982 RepID=UPI00209D96FD|nr:pyrroloquinoline quinone biosynthesis protein PqqE [Notoacmeibacter sp. MSK16QG-6]MCP1200671.1 pyrroloquinoline quinone biosynthesis protein PqqE [Notoacmeibacter sp. MSK16QG-6]
MTEALEAERVKPSSAATPAPPIALLAELTHRCPLACPYCSNPVALKPSSEELTTEQWVRVLREAAALGVLHVHFSGGEPLARSDLAELTAAARNAGLYTNLITSGIGLTQKRLKALAEAGMDHVQLSLQGTDAAMADLVAGYKGGYERKLAVADWVRAEGLPLTVNAVCHRHNMDRLEEMIDLSVRLGARRLEVATVQFHGWAERNRTQLMPTPEQAQTATRIVGEARERLRGILVIDYVPADYHARYPKPCMEGWGRVGLNIDPTGKVLPCHAAETIGWLEFDNVRSRLLDEIWYDGAAFNAFRGTDWMQEPCQSCERRDIDFGGCRCQAMALAGDAAATDPVCVKSPLHGELQTLAASAAHEPDTEFVYRGRA